MSHRMNALDRMDIEEITTILKGIKKQGIGFIMELIEHYEYKIETMNYTIDQLSGSTEQAHFEYGELRKIYDKLATEHKGPSI